MSNLYSTNIAVMSLHSSRRMRVCNLGNQIYGLDRFFSGAICWFIFLILSAAAHIDIYEFIFPTRCPKRFFNVPAPASIIIIFVYFKDKLYRINVDFSRIRTRIIGVEGKHADHLTTTSSERCKKS